MPLAVLLVVVQWTVVAGAGTPIKTGKYSGKTTQQAVSTAFRTIKFTVKKGKVTLTTEPSVGVPELHLGAGLHHQWAPRARSSAGTAPSP